MHATITSKLFPLFIYFRLISLRDYFIPAVKLNYKHNPNSYWYAFNYEGRNSLFIYLFLGNYPPIPHGSLLTLYILLILTLPLIPYDPIGDNFQFIPSPSNPLQMV